MPLDVRISRLGAQGDGVAETANGSFFVGFALPDERVRIEPDGHGKHARLLQVLIPSPDRVEPVCPHFGVCGGCALQHLKPEAYRAWKQQLVVGALKSRGLEAPVEVVRSVPLESRRRARFGYARDGRQIKLGYRRARSHDLIDIEVCPILTAGIVQSLPKLKEMLSPFLASRRELRIAITETETGLDVAVDGLGRNFEAEAADLAELARQAGKLGVARIVVGNKDFVFQHPEVRFGRASVRLPPRAFLQASRDAEAVMTVLVREGVGKAKHVADLFAGLGTFSLVLAESARVDAFEADEAALVSLVEAARHTEKLKPVRACARDLFRNPLGHRELDAYDAVVLDPPRAGAASQAEQLARSKVKRVVCVSCNPGTLVRDLRMLVDGGYRLTRVVPVDQFLFSSHIEVVAHLSR